MNLLTSSTVPVGECPGRMNPLRVVTKVDGGGMKSTKMGMKSFVARNHLLISISTVSVDMLLMSTQ